MLKACKIAGLTALIAYPVLFWIWQSYGFPIDVDACQHYATNGECKNYAPEHIYLFLPRKLGELLGDSAFVTALATIVMAGFTGTLWWSTRGMLNATNETIRLAREEFAATHRPKIIVYGVDVQLPGNTGNERHVHFRFVNIGDTDAVVTAISSRIQVSQTDRPPAALKLHRHTVLTGPISVGSGEHGIAITPDAVSFINLVRSGKKPDGYVFCVGVIAYRDKNNIERLTGFCRRYDGHSERWLQVADQDYEYAY